MIRSPAVAAASSARLRASASAARVASRRPADGSANPKSGSPRRSAPAAATASSSAPSVATSRRGSPASAPRGSGRAPGGARGSRARAETDRPRVRDVGVGHAARLRRRAARAAIRRLARVRAPADVGRAARPSTAKSAMSGVSVAVPMPSAETSGVVSVRLRGGGSERAARRAQSDQDEGAHGRASTPDYGERTSMLSRSPPSWSTCRVVCSIPNRSCSTSSSSHARAVAVVVEAPTSTCADSAGKPEVTSQTCRSWTSLDAVHADHRRADRGHVDPARRGLQEDPARVAQQDHAARSITAATNSEAIPSARSNPVTRITSRRSRSR